MFLGALEPDRTLGERSTSRYGIATNLTKDLLSSDLNGCRSPVLDSGSPAVLHGDDK